MNFNVSLQFTIKHPLYCFLSSQPVYLDICNTDIYADLCSLKLFSKSLIPFSRVPWGESFCGCLQCVRNPFVWSSSQNSVQRASRRNTEQKKKKSNEKRSIMFECKGKKNQSDVFILSRKKGESCKTIYNVSVPEEENLIENVCVLWYLEPEVMHKKITNSALRGLLHL